MTDDASATATSAAAAPKGAEPRGHETRDSFIDLQEQIGTDSDVLMRLRCLELAASRAAKYDIGSDIPEVLYMARRYARFVIEGTTPGLQVRF